jgi:hypothetical protein
LGELENVDVYLYVNNRPIISVDPDGRLLFGAIVGVLAGGFSGAYGSLNSGGSWSQAISNGLIGAAIGGILGSFDPTEGVASLGTTLAITSGIGAISGGAGDVIGQLTTKYLNGNQVNIDWDSVNANAAGGALGGLAAGAGGFILADALTDIGAGLGTQNAIGGLLAFGPATMAPSAYAYATQKPTHCP